MENQSSQFEEILIPPVLLADIYSHSLVLVDIVDKIKKDIPKKEPVLAESSKPAANYMVEETKIAPPLPINEVNEPGLNWLGGFAKKVLIIVNDENAVHVGEEELEMLVKMIVALGLSLADVAIVNIALQPFTLSEITEKLPASKIFLFGVEPSSIGLPMRFPYFQIQRWSGSVYLYSPSLKQLNTPSADQNNLKQSLWTAMKAIFKPA